MPTFNKVDMMNCCAGHHDFSDDSEECHVCGYTQDSASCPAPVISDSAVVAKLREAVDAWPQYETEDEINGGDMVDWFAGWREETKALLAGAPPPQQIPSAVNALKALLEWAEIMGGWEAPCWDAAKAVVAEADASALQERERIAEALDCEASLTPCAEDAVVVRDCARLVRANFSYEEAERLAAAEGRADG